VRETFYRPALDRHRGTHLEVVLAIPPASTVTLTYDFEKAILRYTEYPPDANRGFDVAAAVVRLLSIGGQAQKDVYVRTTTLLLPLPTPDFSMPYNVIILTSTVMALGFGSIFNLLVRRIVAADEVPVAGLAVAVAGSKARIGKLLQSLAARFGKGGEKKAG
jgi:phosphatidylinositol glycan class T